MSHVYQTFEDHCTILGAPIPLVWVAWDYATRFREATRIHWWTKHVYMYACLSLAAKVHSDQDTSYELSVVIGRIMRNYFSDDLATREVEVAKALNWNLSHEHPVPPPPSS